MMPYGHNPLAGEDSQEHLMLDINEYSSCSFIIAIEKLINFVDFLPWIWAAVRAGFRKHYSHTDARTLSNRACELRENIQINTIHNYDECLSMIPWVCPTRIKYVLRHCRTDVGNSLANRSAAKGYIAGRYLANCESISNIIVYTGAGRDWRLYHQSGKIRPEFLQLQESMQWCFWLDCLIGVCCSLRQHPS